MCDKNNTKMSRRDKEIAMKLVRRIENIIVDYYDSEDENYNAGECLVKIDFCIMDFENDLRSIKIMTKELTEVKE